MIDLVGGSSGSRTRIPDVRRFELATLGLVMVGIVAASFGGALAQISVPHEFRICLGDYALCTASICTPDGEKIAVNRATMLFDEAQCTCPIFSARSPTCGRKHERNR
jgi:hypothetical protein